MSFNRTKYQVLHFSDNNPIHSYRLGMQQMESCTEGKNLGMLTTG